jgi:lysophospholipase L1-like esterase
MTTDVRPRSLTRRRLLLGATAIAVNALASACGSNVPITPAATAIPAAGTRLASNLATSTPIVATTTIPTAAAAPATTAATIRVPTVGTTLATTTGTPTMPLIVFVGGSVPSGLGVQPTESVPAQTVALLGPGKYDAVTISNASGSTFGQWTTLAPTTIDPLYAASRSKNIVVLFGGSGDLVGSASVADTIARLVTFGQARRRVGFKVVITSLLARTGSLGGLTPGEFEIERQDYNASVRKNFASFADALADIAADPTIGAAGATANRTYYQSDEVNPTAAGHRIIAGIVKAAILSSEVGRGAFNCCSLPRSIREWHGTGGDRLTSRAGARHDPRAAQRGGNYRTSWTQPERRIGNHWC